MNEKLHTLFAGQLCEACVSALKTLYTLDVKHPLNLFSEFFSDNIIVKFVYS